MKVNINYGAIYGRLALVFGYIKPCDAELKMKEHNAFKSVYCGLCRQLGRSFGFWARMTLNYDFVFLAMLYYGTTDEMPEICNGRCFLNPFKQIPVCKPDKGLEYTADVAALMIHYKLEDNVLDSGLLKKGLWKSALALTSSSWKNAAERQPFANDIVRNMMEKQKKVEEQNSESIDQACEPTAWAMGELLSAISTTQENQIALRRMGYLVGRYVYLCDALEDMEQDIKSGNYNPFLVKYNVRSKDDESLLEAVSRGRDSLFMTVGEIGVVSSQLEFTCFEPIIRNIIDYGMKQSVLEIINKDGECCNENTL